MDEQKPSTAEINDSSDDLFVWLRAGSGALRLEGRGAESRSSLAETGSDLVWSPRPGGRVSLRVRIATDTPNAWRCGVRRIPACRGMSGRRPAIGGDCRRKNDEQNHPGGSLLQTRKREERTAPASQGASLGGVVFHAGARSFRRCGRVVRCSCDTCVSSVRGSRGEHVRGVG